MGLSAFGQLTPMRVVVMSLTAALLIPLIWWITGPMVLTRMLRIMSSLIGVGETMIVWTYLFLLYLQYD